ncbi:unnamed protein product, partial [Staurois parvus]
MEEFLEEHRESFKEVIMEPFSDTNPPERCPHPLYSQDSTQEDHEIPHHNQSEELRDMKVKIKQEEEEMFVKDDQLSSEEVGIMVTIKEEESSDVMMDNQPPLTSPDGSSNGNPPERCPRPLY